MKIGRNRHGWAMLNVWRRGHGSWGIDVNEGGHGLIFNLHHYKAADTANLLGGWFVYFAYWFTPRFNGRHSKMWWA